jgi:hypothetical protein
VRLIMLYMSAYASYASTVVNSGLCEWSSPVRVLNRERSLLLLRSLVPSLRNCFPISYTFSNPPITSCWASQRIKAMRFGFIPSDTVPALLSNISKSA